MRLGRAYIPLVALLLATCLPTCGNADTPTKAERFDGLLSRYEDRGFLSGAVLIGQHGKVTYARGFGEANIETHAPNTPQTKFGIGSITKQFTAALVLQQVAEGRIALNATVADYLQWYRQDTAKRITVEQLLHHTSGLPDDFDAPAFNATPAGVARMEPQPFVEEHCESDLTAEPGTKWQYSNCGYDILGLILEKVTGVRFAELLKKRILEPLDMHDSGLDQNGLVLSNRALGYERHFGPSYVAGPHLDPTHIFSAGAMYSTVEDLFRWNQALSSDGLFPGEIREQVFRPGLGDWGYGWFITKIPSDRPGSGNTLTEMRGDMPGNFFASISRYPDQNTVIIVLRNGYGSSERLEANLQAVLFDASPRVPWRKPADLIVRSLQIVAGPGRWFLILVLLVSSAGLSLLVRWRRPPRTVLSVAGVSKTNSDR